MSDLALNIPAPVQRAISSAPVVLPAQSDRASPYAPLRAGTDALRTCRGVVAMVG